jgi:hypothetical protein
MQDNMDEKMFRQKSLVAWIFGKIGIRNSDDFGWAGTSGVMDA